MAPNFPGPYELRINYVTTISGIARDHQLRVSMDMSTAGDPGDPFTDFTCLSRGGATPELETFTDNFVTQLRAHFNSAATEFVDAELWKYDPGSYNAAFQSVYGIGLAGTATQSPILDAQSILTFRTQNGGSARIDMREGIYGAGAKVAFGASPAAVQSLGNFLTAVNSPMLGRDNSYPFVALNWLPGLNERAFKKRLR